MSESARALPLPTVLKSVSRSFYLSLKFLPVETRHGVGLAYLLARAADSIADTPHLPVALRLEQLQQLRGLYEAAAACPPGFPPATVIVGQESAGERALLTQLPACLTAYAATAEPDRNDIRDVLRVLTAGMVDDLKRFPDAGAAPGILPTRADLDRYCYSVAGVVGEFWTRIHLRHRPALSACDASTLIADGVRLGKGLQMTNVLRDLPRDLRRGRCYLPEADVKPAGLVAADLLQPDAWPRVRPIVFELIQVGFEHLRAGLRYVKAVPVTERALRRTAWWPLAFAVDTLGRLRSDVNLLDPAVHVKSSRGFIYRTLVSSWWSGCSDDYLDRQFAAASHAAGLI